MAQAPAIILSHLLLPAVLALLIVTSPAAAGLPLAPVADVPLEGGTGRFDYQSLDAASHRLFVSHMGAGTVAVFDTEARRQIADLPDFPGATGILVVPALNRTFVSVTGGLLSAIAGGGRIAAIDTKSLKTVWTLAAGHFPDGIAYVPENHTLYVSDENGAAELIVDAIAGKLIATIPLGGEAGMTALDPQSGRVRVNVQTTGELVAIDPKTNRIVGRDRLQPDCKHNHGLLIDGHQAFIACDGNAKLVVYDLAAWHESSFFYVGDEPDVLALDPVRHRLYVASESGNVSVIDTAALKKLGDGFAGPDAHSIAVDPASGLVYLPLRNLHGRPVMRIMAPVP
jgi:DNA-binding beta-propeller fold protein YncE